jgi:hypothetical protein
MLGTGRKQGLSTATQAHREKLGLDELACGLIRIFAMHSHALQMFAVVTLLTGFVLGQDSGSAPTSTPTPTDTTSVSTIQALKPIELMPDASGAVPAEQIRQLLLRAETKDMENDKRQRDYTYIEREERHHLDGRGGVQKVESRTSEVLQIYGEDVERLIAKDDKPLPSDEAKKEDEKIQKMIDKRQNESEDTRRKRLAKEEKDREDDRKFVLEIADAFDFRLIGSEAIDGRDAWVLEGEPRPGYEPKQRGAKLLTKFKGRVWIDKRDDQWVKLDITAIDNISFGLVLARIHKGAHVVVELLRVNDEVWLPKHVQFHIDARVALLKNYDEDIEQTFRDYKKFRTDSKITVVGETQ